MHIRSASRIGKHADTSVLYLRAITLKGTTYKFMNKLIFSEKNVNLPPFLNRPHICISNDDQPDGFRRNCLHSKLVIFI